MKTKLRNAVNGRDKQTREHESFTESFPEKVVEEWTKMAEEWKRDHDKPNLYEMMFEEHGNVSRIPPSLLDAYSVSDYP